MTPAEPTLLDGKVVVVSGVGPGLGRAIGLRCARSGADVVLAARTDSRLEEVAADITDADAAAHLVETALETFGRVDTLVNNAFVIPPLADLAEADFERIRAGFEANVLAALRLTRLFTSALAESGGSVVMINSSVLRHSQRLFGGRFLHSYPYREAYLLDQARQFRSALSMPLILLGGITQKETMDLAMAEGFEFVAMARALLREPDLLDRMQREEATRSLCIQCNKCMPTIYDREQGTHCVLAQ